jgi:hypothetical protein
MMLYAAGSVRDVSVDADNLCGLTWSGQCLWYSDSIREQVVAVDPYTATTVQRIRCEGLRVGLAIVDGNLVYAAGPDLRLQIIDPNTGTLLAEARNPRPGEVLGGLEGGRDGLWMGYRDCLELRRVTDFALLNSTPVPGSISGITVTDRYVAYSDRRTEAITLVDTVLGQAVLPINVHGTPTGLAWDGSRVWYCDTAASRLRAIDVPGIVRSL